MTDQTDEPDEPDEPDDPEQLDEQTTGTLRVLTRTTPVTTGWRAGDVVRRTAVLRRRRRTGYGATAVLVAVGLGVAAATSGGGAQHHPPVHAVRAAGIQVGDRLDGAVQLVSNDTGAARDQPPFVAPVVAAQQSLAIKLLQHLGPGNVTVSPLSLQLALGMLQNGARGATRSQIATALQSSGLTTAQQDAGLATLTHELASAAAAGHLTLESANSLWQQQGVRVRRQFLATLAAFYAGGVWQTDFSTEQGEDAINAWTAQHTRGKITKLFDHLDPSTVLVLANALYLHADWRTPFDANDTKPGVFTTAAGDRVRAKFMSGNRGLQTAVTSGYEAVQLPYRGDRFAALAIMPTGRSLTSYVADLTPSTLDAVAASVHAHDAGVALPKFTTRTTTNLKPLLRSLGMRDAFSPGAADLSGISPSADNVDQVVQRDYLKVSEKGTTAAAVTGISAVAVSALPVARITLDHPFLFLIRDTKTGAILFASEITDPTAG